MSVGQAVAHPNIALTKYWGKRNTTLNLPHQSSISVVLAPFFVRMRVELRDPAAEDHVVVHGEDASKAVADRVLSLVELVRAASAPAARVSVTSEGNFPMAAGLASSAASFAALAVATRRAFGLPRDEREESILARRGSGSASRSIAGGFVRWNRGKRDDGLDSFGVQLADEHHWPKLRLVAAMVSDAHKEVSSRDGMRSTVETSPYYPAWADIAERQSDELESYLLARDLEALGNLAERNAFLMHATALGANPPLAYLRPQTLELWEACRAARRSGVGVWMTLDAGPNPFFITEESALPQVEAFIRAVGVATLHVGVSGGGARLEEPART